MLQTLQSFPALWEKRAKIDAFGEKQNILNLLTGFFDLIMWVSFQAPGSETEKRERDL